MVLVVVTVVTRSVRGRRASRDGPGVTRAAVPRYFRFGVCDRAPAAAVSASSASGVYRHLHVRANRIPSLAQGSGFVVPQACACESSFRNDPRRLGCGTEPDPTP